MADPTVHIPILRAGRPYRSLDVARLTDVRTGVPVATVSQANPGIISHDLGRSADHRRVLRDRTVAELITICQRAATLFAEADLPLGDDVPQSPADYVRQLSSTTGLPASLVRSNRDKLRLALTEMDQALAGLTRGLDLTVLDADAAPTRSRPLSFRCEATSLGAILPSNSPGVHGLWLPAIPLKVPVVLKPGRHEPWTPWRLAQAFIAAGCPPEAFSLYPTSHDGATQILLRSERSLLFGDGDTVAAWRNDPRVQLHGPGWSKIVVGADRVDDWPRLVDTMVTSIASNGGRSCLNASGIWVAGHGRAIAEAVAERLANIAALPLDHPDATLAAFPDAASARAISAWIDRQLAIPGAEDVTARLRTSDRVVEVGGSTFILPTLIYCERPTHPLASAELLFPFASVVELPQKELLAAIGPTLVGTVVTADPAWTRDVVACPNIDRLNLGNIPTTRITWDQPHEGNLFAQLYCQRALQVEGAAGS